MICYSCLAANNLFNISGDCRDQKSRMQLILITSAGSHYSEGTVRMRQRSGQSPWYQTVSMNLNTQDGLSRDRPTSAYGISCTTSTTGKWSSFSVGDV